ncbi:hypothetical protein B1222_14525 [Paenibacillus larvae subsp. pulvifaciens]|uniref:hypothetical protein n=1 Tax=Paenibacillus larvae TaxID=1464 RepID=UPI00098EF5A6|nr:hypothetical protein [Paenibacillus larvae]AQT85347.1 hypothetical protein B1222_14525 [Paenibacillus larvae subsp. pulvifaciens]AQZ47349.1 hypothetical protein B5S25_12885 [Paenibacillus larvae subsp. pulvifaciens]MBH0343138.1 hypothetical protein [Paenibacillus larvae]MCY7519071.1 hypothetical protein [Paenibacillus larvae]MCY9499686.1 hypothetical protein [Paenibacillus larvae]
MAISKKQVKSLVEKYVYVMIRQREILEGILHRAEDKIYLNPNDKQIGTRAFTPFFNPYVFARHCGNPVLLRQPPIFLLRNFQNHVSKME